MGNNKDAVELILKEDPEYHHKRSNKNSDLKSLAYIAAEKRYKDIVKLVCETYEARNEIGHWGQTTLHAAIIGRDAGIYAMCLNTCWIIRDIRYAIHRCFLFQTLHLFFYAVTAI